MLARVLTLRFGPALEAFDDRPLREFLEAREAIAVHERFFVRNHVPCLTPRKTKTSRLRANVRVGTTSRPAPQLATSTSLTCALTTGSPITRVCSAA